MYLWILLGIFTVMVRAALNPYQKDLLNDYSESQVLVLRDTFALLILLPLTLYIIQTTAAFGTQRSGLALVGSGILNIAGAFMVFAALKREDASIVIPLASLTPVLTSVIEPIILRTQPSITVITGALLATIGGFIISWKGDSLKRIAETADKKALSLALSVNIIYGFAATFDGIATTTFNPILVAFLILLFIWIGSITRLKIEEQSLTQLRQTLQKLAKRDKGLIGLLQGTSTVATFATFSLAPSAAQATIIFQLTAVSTVISTQITLNEPQFRRRLIGTIIIFLGTGIAIAL